MSELPDRPDLDQLRRQARELLRAAKDGQASALGRLSAVSERVTLSAAQLAVARAYGCQSWPLLRAEVERRRRMSGAVASTPFKASDEGSSLAEPVESLAEPVERWSFGGAAAIETAVGVLFPEALIVGAGHAVLDALLMPSQAGRGAAVPPRRMPAPGMPLARWARRRRAKAATATMRALARFDDVTVVHDRGATYDLSAAGMSGRIGPSGRPAGPASVQFGLDPVPAREVGWLELRSQAGAATRLEPSARPPVQVGQLTPTALSPAERELSDQAHSLIGLRLGDDGETRDDVLAQPSSVALAWVTEIQRSGELDLASELPDQLAQLCAVLAGQRPAGGLPASWSGMLNAARRADGPRHHLDIGAALPPIDGVIVQVDSMISRPASWRLYLRAMPGWWNVSEDGRRKWNPVSVHAEDDRGGWYLSGFGGSTRHLDRDELALRFLPRLDPLAGAVKLTFRGASADIAIDIALPRSRRQPDRRTQLPPAASG